VNSARDQPPTLAKDNQTATAAGPARERRSLLGKDSTSPVARADYLSLGYPTAQTWTRSNHNSTGNPSYSKSQPQHSSTQHSSTQHSSTHSNTF